jgi:integrase
MPNLHLTELSVRALKPTETYKTYWDATTPGFGVRVGKRAKTWTIMRGLTRERVTIGRYPDLSLSDARIEAKKLLLENPEPKTSVLRFEDARKLFLEEHYRDASARTLHEATRHLTKHFKVLEKKTLDQIDDQDVKGCLDKLKRTPSEQLHAYRFARCFFKWCTRPPRKFIRHSPMEGYEPPGKDRKGTRVLSDKELAAVWKAAEGPTLGILRLLILWGTRQGETVALEREWLSEGVLTIPGTHTKNGRDHGIPVLPLAEKVLAGLKGTNRHYFASRWGDSHLSDGAWSKIKREVQKLSGTKNWQLRDLRRTFRSNMARLKVPREVCEVLINHAPPVLDEIYDRYDRIEEKRDALKLYETLIRKLVS